MPACRAMVLTLISCPLVVAALRTLRTRAGAWCRRGGRRSWRRCCCWCRWSCAALRSWVEVGSADAGHAERDAAVAAHCGDGVLDLSAVVVGQFVEVCADAADQPADPGDLFVGGCCLGAGPVVDVAGGEQACPPAWTLDGSVQTPNGTTVWPIARRAWAESSRACACRQTRLPWRSNWRAATRSTASRRRLSPTE